MSSYGMSMQRRRKMLRLRDPQRHQSGNAMHRNATSTHHSNANLPTRILHSYPDSVRHLKRVVRGKKQQREGKLLLMGAGQGNGAAPTAYGLLSVAIIKIMALLGFGAVFTTAISLQTISVICSMFVDDCDLWKSSKSTTATGEDIAPQMQKAADAWEGCLAATGGALSPKKSFWYLVDYKWTGTQWDYGTKAEMPANLTMKDRKGVTHVLRRHKADHTEKTLGVHTAPDGSMERWFENEDGTRTITGEFSYLESKIEEFVSVIRSSRNTEENDIWQVLTTTLMKTLEYPMAATTLSKEHWDALMSPILRICLPKGGYSCNFPHAIMYGPTDFGGRGLMHPWYNQVKAGRFHLCFVMSHGRQSTPNNNRC